MISPAEIQATLEKALPGSTIEILDLTGGGDHWQVYIETTGFAGLSRIQQHQAVMKIFAEELKTGEVHALSLVTKVKV